MFDALNADPLAFGQSMLEKRDYTQIAGGLGSFALGPFGGLAAGAVAAGVTANNVAQARAAVEVAKSRGLDTAELEANIDKYVEGLPNAARLMAQSVTGERIVDRFNNQLEQTSAVAPTPPQPAGAGAPTPPAPAQSAAAAEAERQRQASAQAEANRQAQAARAEAERQRQASAQAEANRQYQASLQAARSSDNDDRPTSWDGGRVAENQAKPAAQSPSESRASAQRAAERQGTSLATRGRATGGLVARPTKNKTVAKEK
jgi:type IV secretory pathway VirB10-like protein